MAGGRCESCGAAVVSHATVCLTCGRPIAKNATEAASDHRAFDRAETRALSRVAGGAILGILAFLLALAVGVSELRHPPAASAGGLLLLAIALVAVLWAQLWEFRGAFRDFAPFEPAFSWPAAVTPLALIGLPLLCVGIVGIFWAQTLILSCPGAGLGGCSSSGAALGFLGVTLIGGVLELAGLVGAGTGLWRFGQIYSDRRFKWAAVLTFVVGIAGAPLLLAAVRSVSTRTGDRKQSRSAAGGPHIPSD
jgi:hypothetical protein